MQPRYCGYTLGRWVCCSSGGTFWFVSVPRNCARVRWAEQLQLCLLSQPVFYPNSAKLLSCLQPSIGPPRLPVASSPSRQQLPSLAVSPTALRDVDRLAGAGLPPADKTVESSRGVMAAALLQVAPLSLTLECCDKVIGGGVGMGAPACE